MSFFVFYSSLLAASKIVSRRQVVKCQVYCAVSQNGKHCDIWKEIFYGLSPYRVAESGLHLSSRIDQRLGRVEKIKADLVPEFLSNATHTQLNSDPASLIIHFHENLFGILAGVGGGESALIRSRCFK